MGTTGHGIISASPELCLSTPGGQLQAFLDREASGSEEQADVRGRRRRGGVEPAA